jgi:hypothetical protein
MAELTSEAWDQDGPARVTYQWLCRVCGTEPVPEKDQICIHCSEPEAA